MPRRPNNEGSVYFDTSQSRWVCAVPYQRADGTRFTKKTKWRTKTEAEAHRRAMVKARGEIGRSMTDPDMTIDEWAAFMRSHVWPKAGRRGKPVSPSTLGDYEWLIRDYIVPGLGGRPMAEVRPVEVELWLDSIPRPHTRAYAFRLARSMFARAVRPYKILSSSPFDDIRVSAPESEDDRALTAAEVRILLATGLSHWLEGMVRVAVGTGMRKGEIVGLTWAQVDLDRRTVMVDRQWDESEKVDRPPKSGKARIVPIPPSVAGWLYDHRQSTGGEGLVFATKVGTHIGQRNVTRSFHAALDKAGLPRVKFHSLRKTASTVLLEAGSDARIRSEILGHSSPVITEEVYTQAMLGVLADAAGRADKILSPENDHLTDE